MKKISIILFSAVFATGVVMTPKSFIFQHEIGLFLWLPDYFRDVFSGAFPVSTLIGDFLVQFYKYPLVGPLCTASIITITYLLTCGILKHITRHFSLFALIISLAEWFFVARSTTPIIGVASILILAIIRLASCLIKRTFPSPKPRPVLEASIIILAAIIISVDPVIRKLETWSKIEIAAKQGNWDAVLKAATPSKAAKDREIVPYALLAAGAKGQLQQALTRYEVSNPGEMDFSGIENRRAYYFESLLSEKMGSINEAVHNIFQCGCHTHRGTSFAVLTQLIRYNIELGNYSLVRKYSEILRRCPAYRATANDLLRMYDGWEDETVDGGPAELAAVATENPMYNIVFMEQCGISSQFARDRYSAYAYLLNKYQNR